ncbi:MAG: FHA domain-containing protein [Bacteroidota bacterium]
MVRESPGSSDAPPPLRVEGDDGVWTFDCPFTVGREHCDVVVDSARASRRHLQISPADGVWWLQDLGSSNGTYIDGERVEHVPLSGETTVQVGQGGLFLRFTAGTPVHTPEEPVIDSAHVDSSTPEATPDPFRPTTPLAPPHYVSSTPPRSDSAPPPSPEPPRADDSETPPPSDELSYDAVVERYFGEGGDEEQMGERTRFIRQAYDDLKKAQEEVTEKQHSRYRGLIVAALLVSVVALGYAGYQEYRVRQLRTEAVDLFNLLRTNDVAVAQQVEILNQQIEANPQNADSLNVDLERALETRRRTAARYDRFVRSLGVYDGLSSQEELIYRTARAFGESELMIPPDFVDELQVQINYWKNGARWRDGIRRAQLNGHDVDAVNALRRHGMPTEFFFLALQESDFKTRIVGPPTRYGFAKGAWQFIPETGRRYGLESGPLVNERVYDPLDERHDFPQAADAAARYLRDIYIHLTQASGLLVLASYNWGEGNVRPKMRGIANDPESRTYWKFLTTYRSRMPNETKDYVMKIFAAAVIGQNPRLFGIDMDPPVQIALAGGRGGIRTDDAPTSGRTARLGTNALQQRQTDEAPLPSDSE